MIDVIITAGGVPTPEDSLYPYTGGRSKALIDVAGKPMVQWVLDAVGSVNFVENVVVIGLESKDAIGCQKPMVFVPDNGSMLDNIRAGVNKVMELNPSTEYVILVSSDIPSITGEMIEWVKDNTKEEEADISYCVIPRQVMESRFPDSNRSFVRFKDLEICGGDIIVFRAEVAYGRDMIWNRLISARKSALKQVSMIGFDLLLLMALRRLTLEEAIKRVSNRLGLTGKALLSPYAEIGMDIDKSHQLEILRADLLKRAALES